MTAWFAFGLIVGASLACAQMTMRRARLRRREAWKAHIQAVAVRHQLTDAARNMRIDVSVAKGGRS